MALGAMPPGLTLDWDGVPGAGLTTREKPEEELECSLPVMEDTSLTGPIVDTAAPLVVTPAALFSHSLPIDRCNDPVELTPELLCIESELRHLFTFLFFSWSSLLGMCWP